MTKLPILLIAFFLLSGPFTTTAQNQDRAKHAAALLPVQLLSGYQVRIASGIDAWNGTIWKDGGVKIEFDHGSHVGVAADLVEKSDVVWREEQVVNGHQMICVYTKSNHLIVSIPKRIVNFEASIRNHQDLTEMLLMVLTYEPTHGYPVEPATNGAAPQAPK